VARSCAKCWAEIASKAWVRSWLAAARLPAVGGREGAMRQQRAFAYSRLACARPSKCPSHAASHSCARTALEGDPLGRKVSVAIRARTAVAAWRRGPATRPSSNFCDGFGRVPGVQTQPVCSGGAATRPTGLVRPDLLERTDRLHPATTAAAPAVSSQKAHGQSCIGFAVLTACIHDFASGKPARRVVLRGRSKKEKTTRTRYLPGPLSSAKKAAAERVAAKRRQPERKPPPTVCADERQNSWSA